MSDDGEIIDIALSSLVKGPEVRADRVDGDHAHRLVPFLDSVPPIIVRRKDDRSYQVIDGHHRWAGAKHDGRDTIRAVIVTMADAEALEAAVRANVSHGLPLTMSERKKAATTLVRTTRWSDRRIADACGISHQTVARIRPPEQSGGPLDHLPREGKDDKSYPAPEPKTSQPEPIPPVGPVGNLDGGGGDDAEATGSAPVDHASPPAPSSPIEVQIPAAVIARERLSKAVVRCHDLLDVNPEEVGSYLLTEDRTAHLRFCDELTAWAEMSRKSLRPTLKAVPGEA